MIGVDTLQCFTTTRVFCGGVFAPVSLRFWAFAAVGIPCAFAPFASSTLFVDAPFNSCLCLLPLVLQLAV